MHETAADESEINLVMMSWIYWDIWRWSGFLTEIAVYYFYLFRWKKLRYPTALKTKISAISTGSVLTQEWEKTKIVHAAGKLWFSMVYDQLRPNLMIKMFYILRWQWQMVTKSSSGPGIFAVRSSERMSFAYVHDAYLCFASFSVWRPNRLMAVFSWVIIFFQHLLLISECNYEIKRS